MVLQSFCWHQRNEQNDSSSYWAISGWAYPVHTGQLPQAFLLKAEDLRVGPVCRGWISWLISVALGDNAAGYNTHWGKVCPQSLPDCVKVIVTGLFVFFEWHYHTCLTCFIKAIYDKSYIICLFLIGSYFSLMPIQRVANTLLIPVPHFCGKDENTLNRKIIADEKCVDTYRHYFTLTGTCVACRTGHTGKD